MTTGAPPRRCTPDEVHRWLLAAAEGPGSAPPAGRRRRRGGRRHAGRLRLHRRGARARRHPQPSAGDRAPRLPARGRRRGDHRAPRRWARPRSALHARDAGRRRQGAAAAADRCPLRRAADGPAPRPRSHRGSVVARVRAGRTRAHLLRRTVGRPGQRRAGQQLGARTPHARRPRARLRARRAVRHVRQERPERRHLERRRRHRQRAGVQERAVLPLRRGLRRLRRPPRRGLVRGRLRGRLRDAVLRARPAAALPAHRRPDAQGRAASLHRAHRATAARAAVVVRPVAVHVVHHLVRRGDRDVVHRRHGGAGSAVVGVPLRLLLDAAVPLVRLRVGPGHVPRPGRDAGPVARA